MTTTRIELDSTDTDTTTIDVQTNEHEYGAFAASIILLRTWGGQRVRFGLPEQIGKGDQHANLPMTKAVAYTLFWIEGGNGIDPTEASDWTA